jgi:hypothetical protein
MNSTTEKPTVAGNKQMSRASIVWDQAEKGYLTEAERTAKNLDVEGKGHLSREQAVSLGSQYQSLKEDNKTIKKQLYGLAILCVILFIGTVAGTVMAVKNSKDTIVDMKTGVMKVNDGTGVDIVTVKAQGTTFQTTGSVVVGHCVSSEDIASMWLANEKGTDARLVISEEVGIDGTVSSIEPVTTGRASWNEDQIVMGGMTFIPNEECTNNNRRKLLESNDIENNDMSSFDSISIHRALKQRVDFLSGRNLTSGRNLNTQDYWVALDHFKDSADLGTAGNFVILSKTGITNTGGSAITGDIGVSPITGAAMTGFALIADSSNTFSRSTLVTGDIYAADYTAPTPSKMTTAISDMETAYGVLAGRTNVRGDVVNLKAGLIGGETLVPGVYTFGSNIDITTDFTFDGQGDSNSVFIIKTTGNVIQAANKQVILIGSAQAKNIFWQVAGTVFVGAGAHMEGIILAKLKVDFITGSSLNGRVLSQTAVNLQSATITQTV